ncbi:hypothetical protein NQ318_005056 [Aromia moschata]|uniref:Uncharacterized protein n=1 Tax=Aromia moschata TaxID=1265417 RepID=A0AAV8YER9_9CUCU|nr:hypothetical protein NQ318_005056 [Aromia moschata]
MFRWAAFLSKDSVIVGSHTFAGFNWAWLTSSHLTTLSTGSQRPNTSFFLRIIFLSDMLAILTGIWLFICTRLLATNKPSFLSLASTIPNVRPQNSSCSTGVNDKGTPFIVQVSMDYQASFVATYF